MARKFLFLPLRLKKVQFFAFFYSKWAAKSKKSCIFAPQMKNKHTNMNKEILQYLHFHPNSDYKKAMLIFYEQNNLHAFKQIFISQYEFAVSEYF